MIEKINDIQDKIIKNGEIDLESQVNCYIFFIGNYNKI